MSHTNHSLKKYSLALLLSTAIAPSVLADAEAEDTQSIEEITVYGEKIERSLKDATSSVSVISAETLQTGQYLSISDAIGEIPNVVSVTGTVANVRGVSGNGAAGGFNGVSGGSKARVLTLVDGVAEPFIGDLTGDTGLWDIQQVEVFRGPQSTTNGRNSIGGSIYVKTKDPSFNWEGAVKAGYRNQDGYYDGAAVVSGPLVEDQLAFRISAQHQEGDTYLDELKFDTHPTDLDLDEIKTSRVRGKLLWQPTGEDNLKLMYQFAYRKEKGDTGRNYSVGHEPRSHTPLFQRYINTETYTNSLKLDYQISDNYALDLLVAHMDHEYGFSGYEALPERSQILDFDEKNITIDGRFSFGINNPDFNGFIGLFYFRRTQDFASTRSALYSGDDISKSKSIYGEVQYAVSERVNVILGGRIENDLQTRNFTLGAINDQLNKDETLFLPKAVVQFEASDNTTLSLSARKGYNSGGGALDFFAQEYYFYDEESVMTYEFSVRSSLNDGNINISANAFYNDFDGYQGSNAARRITNIEGAKTYGLELEANAILSSNLELNLGLGLLDSEITNADAGFGDIVGNELNAAPSFTGNISARYAVTEELSVRLGGNYVGKYFADINNTAEREAGGYFTTRLNIDYETANWKISAFVNNLFDVKEFTVREPIGRRNPEGYNAVVDPRTFGISATYNF